MKKITALLIAVLLVFSSVSVTAYAESTESVYEMNKKQTAATVSYITEMYIENHPEFGLVNDYGGEPDKKVLEDLALSLTKDCASDAQKAQALYDWVDANILYHGTYGYCSYPIDVYYEGIASGHGFAMLLSRLMRLAGIPAVACDGLYGDMRSEVTVDDLKDTQPFYGGGWIDYGDGWVMAYIDGRWSLYDPVHGTAGNTDRSYWEDHYFCEFIEGVVPYYDGIDVNMSNNGNCLFYVDGRPITYYEGQPSDFPSVVWKNGMHYNAKQKDGFLDFYHYLDTPERRDNMAQYEAYSDGFYAGEYSPLFYAWPNGVNRIGGTVEWNGAYYDLGDDGATSFSGCETRQYKYGCPVVLTGETIRIEPYVDKEKAAADGYDVSFTYSVSVSGRTELPDAVTINEDGSITVAAPGYVEIDCLCSLQTANQTVGFYVLEAPRERRQMKPTEETPATIYEMNKKQTAAAIDYITEMYIENYPEFGLVNEYGGAPDKKVLADLVQRLTKNCASDEEKARVLFDWVRDNITYDMGYELCSYPIDVYYEGRAVCYGFAMLFSRLMRIAGIPAVVFIGLYDDMVGTVTKENFMDLLTDYGHAWTMAYLDGQWRLYDTLGDVFGNADRDFWEKWYFCTQIEGVSPYYNGADTELTNNGAGAFYVDGRTIIFLEGVPNDHFDCGVILNGIGYAARGKMQNPDGFTDGYRYVYTQERRVEMHNFQAYYDGFYSYGDTMLMYANPNGINKAGCTVRFEDTPYWLEPNNGIAYSFSDCETRQLMHGCPVVLVGETVTVKHPDDGKMFEGDEAPRRYVYSVSEDTEHPDSVTINADNSITVSEPGYVEINCNWEPYSYNAIGFYVLESPRTHKHIWDAGVVTKQPACTQPGEKICACTGCEETTAEEIPAIGHAWGKATYTWSEDNGTVTASRICANDGSHVETETVKTTAEITKPAACTAVGETTYTAVFTNEAFAAQTKTVKNVPATGHAWGKATYTWSEDNGTVTASRTCANDGSHVETETVKTTAKITKPAACTAVGETTYTAVFTNEAFAAQTKTVKNVPATGHAWGKATYIWSEDNGTVTASRTCANDGSHVETETVKTTAKITKPAACTAAGETTYTAVFTNEAFAAQTKTVKNVPATGHAFGEWKLLNETEHQRVCANDISHAETAAHVWDDGVVTKEPTYTEEGAREYTCAVCGGKKTETLEKLPPKAVTDEETKISVIYIGEAYEGELTLQVEKIETPENVVSLLPETFVKSAVVDITPMLEGKAVQPEAPVTVTIPVPEGFREDALAIYHVHDDGTIEKVDFTVSNGMISFEVSSFSAFAVVDTTTEVKFELGKVDEDDEITVTDARFALRAAVGLENYRPFSREFSAADTDNNGEIEVSDARNILRAAVGLDQPGDWRKK